MLSGKLKSDSEKSSRITFSLKQGAVPPILLNDEIIPSTSSVRYLEKH